MLDIAMFSGFRASLLPGLCQVCDCRRLDRFRGGKRLELGDRRSSGARHQVRVSSGDDQRPVTEKRLKRAEISTRGEEQRGEGVA